MAKNVFKGVGFIYWQCGGCGHGWRDTLQDEKPRCPECGYKRRVRQVGRIQLGTITITTTEPDNEANT